MRVALLAHARTGTTMMRSLLNKHPQIYFYGEVLYPDFFNWGFFSHIEAQVMQDRSTRLPTNWNQYLSGYLDRLGDLMENAGKTIVGYDLKLPQMEMIPNSLASLRESGMPVLHLRRRNTLATVISYETMQHRIAAGGSAHGAKASEKVVLTLDPEWVRLRVAELETRDGWVNYIFGKGRYLELYYENLITAENWVLTCSKLSEFFGIPVTLPFEPTMAKQNSSDLATLLANADVIKKAFPQFFCPPI